MTKFGVSHITLFSIVLAACSGGGDGGAAVPPPPPPPANNAPQFTSPTTASVAENTSGAIYTATASDADGDTLSFTLGSSGDEGVFTLDGSSGELSFSAPPDFETPGDADGDNVYEISLEVSDSNGGSDMLDVSITVTDTQASAQLSEIATGLAAPLYLAGLPDGSGRVVVLEKAGRARLLDPDTGVFDSVDFIDLTAEISSVAERGLLGMAFSPNFATDGMVYFNMSNLDGDTEIRRYQTVSGRTDQLDTTSADIILTVDQPRGNHNAGWIGFDASGLLIIPLGDGGGGGDPDGFALNPQSLLGKVLRLDVTGDDFPADDGRDYAIPAGNTFDDPADGLPEIYAIGLRNPFRASFDPFSGDLIMADVGQDAVEEIDRLPMDDASLNFGWNRREGTQAFNGGADSPDFTDPVAEYFHGTSNREGRSVTGGYVYTGPVEAYQGEYIFADFLSNNIWSVPVDDLVIGQTVSSAEFNILTDDISPTSGVIERISSFGLDENLNLYVLSINGEIYRLDAISP